MKIILFLPFLKYIHNPYAVAYYIKKIKLYFTIGTKEQ